MRIRTANNRKRRNARRLPWKMVSYDLTKISDALRADLDRQFYKSLGLSAPDNPPRPVSWSTRTPEEIFADISALFTKTSTEAH